jgi:hypothetical protein
MDERYLRSAVDYLARIVEAQERIAAADELRNELLVKDAAKRDAALERSFLADQERWASFGAAEPTIEALRALRDTINANGGYGALAAIGEMLSKLEKEDPGVTTND